MTPDSPDRLADLRRRWQAEPGSRLFLQLAEEYRRADRRAEAVEVLEKGLEQHPNHVSAHVALGRVRLDMGEPGIAAAALERALELDVTNLVANKLLVEAYLGRGERERARQRLDLYRLLNDSDPDIADLRRRIDGGRTAAPPPPGGREAAPGEAAAGTDDTAAGVADAPGEALAAGRSRGGEATADSLRPSAAGAGERAATAAGHAATAAAHAATDTTEPITAEPTNTDTTTTDTTTTDAAATDTAATGGRGAGDALEEEPMTTGTGQADERGASERVPGAAAASGGLEQPARAAAAGEPFGDLAAGGAERRYLQGLGREGLFPLPAAEPHAAAPPPAAPPETLPEPRPAEIEALTEGDSPTAAGGSTAAADERAAAGATVTAGAAAAGAARTSGALATTGADAAAPPPVHRSAAAPPAIAAGAVEGPAADAGAAEAGQPAERPTVTLGQLYLDQGHFAQARRVFAALLDEEPDHEVARRGLERAERELAAAGPEPVTAAELLREAGPGQPARRAVLGAYLVRLLRSRESRAADVPR